MPRGPAFGDLERDGAPSVARPTVASLDAAQRERRERIVRAAIAAMLTTEYDRVQMKDVTAAAGVALGTTYRYFASKEHLMSEALLTWSDDFPTDPTVSSGRSVDRLKRAYRFAVRAFEPHPTAYRALVALQASTDPHAVPVFEQFAIRRTTAFENFLPRIAPARRHAIVMVMSAVLDGQLRSWSVGRTTIGDVYRNLDATAELLLGDA